MATILGMPRAETPFMAPDGKTVSREWFLFLAYLQQQLGGPSVAPGGGSSPIDNTRQFEEYAVTSPEAQMALIAVDELRNDDRSIRGDVQALRVAFDDLSASIPAQSIPVDLMNRIQALEDRLA